MYGNLNLEKYVGSVSDVSAGAHVFDERDSLPICVTSQQAWRTLLGNRPDGIDLDDDLVARFECYEPEKTRVGRKFALRVGTRLIQSADIPMASKLKLERPDAAAAAAAEEPPFLPFGLMPNIPAAEADVNEEALENFGQQVVAAPVSDSEVEFELERVPVAAASSKRSMLLEAEQSDVPSGPRLGVVAFDKAKTGRSVCSIICNDLGRPLRQAAIPQGSLRFFRVKPGQPDRSVHGDCVLGPGNPILSYSKGTATHCTVSVGCVRPSGGCH